METDINENGEAETLKCLSLNINGLADKLSIILDTYSDYDILALQETWLSSYEAEQTIKDTPGYIGYYKCRKLQSRKARRHSGGILVLIKNELCDKLSFSTIDIVCDDIIGLKMENDNTKMCLFVCYLPPDGSNIYVRNDINNYFEILYDFVYDMHQEGFQCLMVGDFNSRTASENDIFEGYNEFVDMPELYEETVTPDLHVRVSQDAVLNEFGKSLLEMCKTLDMFIVNGRLDEDQGVGKFTCYQWSGKSLVDYLIADLSLIKKIVGFKVNNLLPFTDHCAISFTFQYFSNFQGFVENQENENNEVSYRYVWDPARVAEYQNNLSSFAERLKDCCSVLDNLNIVDTDRVQSIIDDVVAGITNIIEDSAGTFKRIINPFHTYRKRNAEWWNEDCETKKCLFYQAWDVYQYDSTDVNYSKMYEAKKNYKNCVKFSKRQFNKDRGQTLCNTRDASKLWKLLNKNRRQQIIPKATKEQIYEHFSTINSGDTEELNEFDRDILGVVNSCTFEEYVEVLDKTIEMDEIVTAINSMKTGKAAGVDRMISEFFKAGKDILVPFLCKLFNVILDTGFYPRNWAVGMLHLLHKGGSEADLNNFRDITLLSNFGKIFDIVLNNRIKDWENKSNLLYNTQAGFRKGFSTHDNIFVLQSLITKSRYENKKLYCAFVDFKKAFNSVYRNGLWFKFIHYYNCRGKFLRVIKDMYSKIKCTVRTKEGLTNFFMTSQGVQQGAILSPILFAIFLNDLTDILQDDDGVDLSENCCLKILKYADDIVLVSNSIEGLQNHVDKLYDFCNQWKMTVNLMKTKILVCRGGGPLSMNEHWFWGDKRIEICTSYKYLGINFTAGGITNHALECLADQGRKAMLALRHRQKQLGSLTLKMYLNMFHTCITPIILYSSQTWVIRMYTLLRN